MVDSPRSTSAWYLQMDEKELFSLAGTSLVPSVSKSESSPSSHDLANIGRKWMEEMEVIWFGRLCVQKDLCELLEQPGLSDDSSLLLAVADIVAAVVISVPPFVVSALLIKRGLRSFCCCGREIIDEVKDRYLRRAIQLYQAEKLKLEEAVAQEPPAGSRERSKVCEAVIRRLYTSDYRALVRETGLDLE